MAYRRRQQVARVSTFKEEFVSPNDFPSPPPDGSSSSSASASSASSLAAKAIRASSAYRDSSLSSAYSPVSNPPRSSSPPSAQDASTYEYTSMKNLNEPKQRFWGVLARKAKAILDDDMDQSNETPGRARTQMSDRAAKDQYQSSESRRKTDGQTLQKGLGAIASSLNYIGGTIGNKIEEGLTVMENRTADIIQETRKLQIRKKGNSSMPQNQWQQPAMQANTQLQTQTDLETQLKASRDVAMAMAAKAKLLLRELKTVKADLAFAKERCAQLEEENRILRESREKGDNPDDDDLIRLQLETLLAEKARLAQENSVLARENRFLREIVEYHQLTMQDVVYLDENNEEVSEVYPINKVPMASNLRSRSTSPTPVSFSLPTSMASQEVYLQVSPDVVVPSAVQSSEAKVAPETARQLSSLKDVSAEEHMERR